MASANQVAQFLGLKRGIVGLLVMVILVGMGERIAQRFLPIYLMALGGGTLAIGLLGGLENLLGALYSYPGGYLADRFGAKRSLLFFNILAMVGFAVVVLVPHWSAVLIGALFFLAWSAVSLPATMSLVARILPPQKRTMGVSLHSLVRRFPMALGPIFGGLLIAQWGEVTGVRVGFGVAIVMALVALVAQQKLIEDDRAAREPRKPDPRAAFRRMGPDLRQLLISDILIRFCEQIPNAFVVVWAMKLITHPVDSVQFGLLTGIEMATAVLCYLPVAYLADRTVKRPFVLLTFVFFTIFPLVLLLSQSFWALVGAFVVRGLKEFGEPTRKALILDLSPRGFEAETFGVYYLVRDTIVAVAALAGAALWGVSPTINLITAAVCGAAGTIWFALRGRNVSPA